MLFIQLKKLQLITNLFIQLMLFIQLQGVSNHGELTVITPAQCEARGLVRSAIWFAAPESPGVVGRVEPWFVD